MMVTDAHAVPESTTSAAVYLVTLRFRPGGGEVTGEWTKPKTAFDTFRDWVGLYGDGADVFIQLVKDTAGNHEVLKPWPQDWQTSEATGACTV
ncbi:hypothetical protein OIE69_43825 (plasmid) [Actinacidiphila glaucinigra]|uniref:hypothetical protein n=1 Tax=Actinacidiphila glaucinigra TaxID=235986 RepID=UPI002DDA4ADC|nr:hypothetical protein [Actinacidiphila glaucinigra]WSD65836.1 hypothetical protein OIE69_43825 [Actinacidiphila glaucinigra]